MSFNRPRTSWTTSLAMGLILSGSTCLASVFDQADQLFAQREGSTANVAAARAEYTRLVPSLGETDLAYAVQQLGKLALYEGIYLIADVPANNARKAKIFDDCRKVAAKLKNFPSQVTTYSYWRLSCTAHWIRTTTVIDRLAGIAEVKREFNDLVDDQLEVKADQGIDLRYQGGGINRVLAGIYGDPLSSLIRSGLPDGTKAIDMADRAIRARGFPGDVNQGTDYYSNHRYKANALKTQRRSNEALQELNAAVAEIEERNADSDLPVGIEAETKAEMTLMQNMIQELNGG